MIPGAVIGRMKALAKADRVLGGRFDERAMLRTLLAATLVLCTAHAGAETVRVGGNPEYACEPAEAESVS